MDIPTGCVLLHNLRRFLLFRSTINHRIILCDLDNRSYNAYIRFFVYDRGMAGVYSVRKIGYSSRSLRGPGEFSIWGIRYLAFHLFSFSDITKYICNKTENNCKIASEFKLPM